MPKKHNFRNVIIRKWRHRMSVLHGVAVLGIHNKELSQIFPDSKFHRANMEPTWGRQAPWTLLSGLPSNNNTNKCNHVTAKWLQVKIMNSWILSHTHPCLWAAPSSGSPPSDLVWGPSPPGGSWSTSLADLKPGPTSHTCPQNPAPEGSNVTAFIISQWRHMSLMGSEIAGTLTVCSAVCSG